MRTGQTSKASCAQHMVAIVLDLDRQLLAALRATRRIFHAVGDRPRPRASRIRAVAGTCLGIADGFRLAEPAPEAIFEAALGVWDEDSDGMLIACLNFRSHPIIEALEARIGKPVVTSTQAVLWHTLRLAGVATPVPGYGRLLREH